MDFNPFVSHEPDEEEADRLPQMSFDTATICERNLSPEHNQRLYFAYGSNLSSTQMRERCFGSRMRYPAFLEGYRWTTNSFGHANLHKQAGSRVYGIVYSITSRDEAMLDIHEKLPWVHTKYLKTVEHATTGFRRKALLYINSSIPGVVNDYAGIMDLEYIKTMETAIADGLRNGLDQDFANQFLSPAVARSKWLMNVKEWEDEDEDEEDEDEEIQNAEVQNEEVQTEEMQDEEMQDVVEE